MEGSGRTRSVNGCSAGVTFHQEVQLVSRGVMTGQTLRASEFENVADAALASRAQAGDVAALSRLLERHAALAERVARRVLGNGDVVDDVLQDAALAAFLNIRSLLSPERFSGWYCGIVMNHCRMHLRKKARFREIRSLNGSEFAIAKSTDAVAEERAMLSEVMGALEALPDRQRQAALLVYFDGLTQKEAAMMLGVSAGAVKARLHRARQAIRLKVAPEHSRATPRRRTTMLEVEVYDAFVLKGDEAESTPAHAAVLLKEKRAGRILPIWIGESEGIAIALALEDKELARPITHDLTKRLLDAVNVTVESVKVNKLVGDTFYAVVSVRNGSGSKDVDARPSDAINLALRAEAPLFVEEAVFDDAPATGRSARPGRTGSAAIVGRQDEPPSPTKESRAKTQEHILNAWKELGIELEEE